MQDIKLKNTISEQAIEDIRNGWSWINFFVMLISFLVVFALLKTYMLSCVMVSGDSMVSTFFDKDYLLVVNVDHDTIERGEVIVFERTEGSTTKRYLIKRVIGLPGDTIKTENGYVYLKKKGNTFYEKLDETYLNDKNVGNTWRNSLTGADIAPTIVPEGRVFVMGDNRIVSFDSRAFGTVSYDVIKGVVPKFVIDNREKLGFLYKMF